MNCSWQISGFLLTLRLAVADLVMVVPHKSHLYGDHCTFSDAKHKDGSNNSLDTIEVRARKRVKRSRSERKLGLYESGLQLASSNPHSPPLIATC